MNFNFLLIASDQWGVCLCGGNVPWRQGFLTKECDTRNCCTWNLIKETFTKFLTDNVIMLHSLYAQENKLINLKGWGYVIGFSSR